LCCVCAQSVNAFIHPGGLHTQSDFDRMAAKVAASENPWKATWDKLLASPYAQLSWTPAPVSVICRTGNTSICSNNYTRTQMDSVAVYELAMRWRVSGDTAYAEHAIDIMDAWSSALTAINGDSNGSLGAGIIGAQFAMAAETLNGYSGWSPASKTAFQNMLVNVFYPANHDFLIRHHDTCNTHYRCNWDTCNMASMIAIGVFCDRQDIFDEAVVYFKDGIGNGCIKRAAWYIHPDGLGQTEEAGRDQAHNMGGIHWLGQVCEVAWNQGVDLYGYDNSRYLRALEYIAKYNLFNDVPYVPHRTCDMTYTESVVSDSGLGNFSPNWELAYNHYVNRLSLAAPYTQQVAELMRPDGPPNDYGTHPSRFDWFGCTSLTHMRDPVSQGAIPSGLRASVTDQKVTLSWWGSAYATGYNVKRAATSGGPYTTIGTATVMDTTFADSNAVGGTNYYYVVSANNPGGESDNSDELKVSRSLIAYYKFENDTNDSVGSNDGAVSGTVIYPAGKIGQAVDLDGDKDVDFLDYVELVDNWPIE